jgi:phage terminase small subunit
VQIDADHVLQRLHDIDTLDVADILDGDGNPLPLKSWPAAWRTSISGIDLETVLKIGPGGDVAATKTLVRKLKLPDKLRNLEMIGRHTQVKAWKDEGVETLGKGILELLADVRSERGVK